MARLLMAGLCAFILLCILVMVSIFWSEAGYWIRYYDAEIIVAVVVGSEAGRLIYDWADSRGRTENGA